MVRDYTWCYAFTALVFMASWVLLALAMPRSRSAMLWTGLIFAPAGPISELWHLQDYWHPSYVVPLSIGRLHFGGLEDFVFTFALAGVSAGLFEALQPRHGRSVPTRPSLEAVVMMEGLGLVGLCLMAGFCGLLKLGSVHAVTLAVALTTLLVLWLRPEVASAALLSAAVFAGLFWVFEAAILIPLFPGAFDAIWLPQGNLGIRIGIVPVEEVAWGFVAALFAGPVYRACTTRSQARAVVPANSGSSVTIHTAENRGELAADG